MLLNKYNKVLQGNNKTLLYKAAENSLASVQFNPFLAFKIKQLNRFILEQSLLEMINISDSQFEVVRKKNQSNIMNLFMKEEEDKFDKLKRRKSIYILHLDCQAQDCSMEFQFGKLNKKIRINLRFKCMPENLIFIYQMEFLARVERSQYNGNLWEKRKQIWQKCIQCVNNECKQIYQNPEYQNCIDQCMVEAQQHEQEVKEKVDLIEKLLKVMAKNKCFKEKQSDLPEICISEVVSENFEKLCKQNNLIL